MATLSRITRIRVTETATGNWRQWEAEAAVQDTAEGQAVTVSLRHTTSGGAGIVGIAETLQLILTTDAGVAIRTYTAANANPALEQFTFYLTDNGLVGGTARHGIVAMNLRVQRTSLVAYEVEADGNPSTVPAGQTVTSDVGYMRGTTAATLTVNKSALTDPAYVGTYAYGDSIFARLDTSSRSYNLNSQAVIAIRNAADTADLLTRSVNDNVATVGDGNYDASFVGEVNDTNFAAAAANHLVTARFANSAYAGIPASGFTALNTQTVTVDPRLTLTSLFQIDDNAWAAPPSASHRAEMQMLSTETGFVGGRVTNARGEGRNGITVTATADPAKPGTTIGPVSFVTATQGGEAGWFGFLELTASKPGGLWSLTYDVTAPADVDADGYLVGSSSSFVMTVADPRITRVASGGPTLKAGHFSAGRAFQAGVFTIKAGTRTRVIPDLVDPADATLGRKVYVGIGRFQDAGANAGYAEFLEADGTTWTAVTSDAQVIPYHQCSETRPGSGAYVKTWTAEQTASWGEFDLFVLAEIVVDGTPYGISDKEVSVGASNDHAGYALDALGLALSGALGQR